VEWGKRVRDAARRWGRDPVERRGAQGAWLTRASHAKPSLTRPQATSLTHEPHCGWAGNPTPAAAAHICGNPQLGSRVVDLKPPPLAVIIDVVDLGPFAVAGDGLCFSASGVQVLCRDSAPAYRAVVLTFVEDDPVRPSSTGHTPSSPVPSPQRALAAWRSAHPAP
jgi:hypothetical protein